MSKICTCPMVMIGSKQSGSRNWSENCVEHGLNSEWHNSEEQVAKRAERSKRLKELWAQARAAKDKL